MRPGLDVRDDMLRQQARRLGKEQGVVDKGQKRFSYSDGWLSGFKKRFGIKAEVLRGEAESAKPEAIALARGSVRLLLEGYSADDIFNQDETGVFCLQTPTRRLATGNRVGRKKDKLLITASLACNASGTEKAQHFLIFKA
jgi:hypothetical protein